MKTFSNSRSVLRLIVGFIWLFISIALVWWFIRTSPELVGLTEITEAAKSRPNDKKAGSEIVVITEEAHSYPAERGKDPRSPSKQLDAPKVVAAAQQQLQQQRVMKTFGSALHSLQLSPETFIAVRDLIYERDRISRLKPGRSIDGGPSMTREAIDDTKRDIERQLVEKLGEVGYAQLKIRVEVDRRQDEIKRGLAVDMLDANVPLSAEQIEELALSYVAQSTPGSQGGTRLTESLLSAEQKIVLEKHERIRALLNEARQEVARKAAGRANRSQ